MTASNAEQKVTKVKNLGRECCCLKFNVNKLSNIKIWNYNRVKAMVKW